MLANGTTKASTTPRTYANGKRGNAAAIAKHFGIKEDWFRTWQRKGWPALKGQRLASIMEPLGYFGREEPTYSFVEAEPVIRGHRPLRSGWADPKTFADESGTYRTVAALVSAKVLPRKSAVRWSAGECDPATKEWKEVGCRYLPDGRAIAHKWVEPAMPRNRKLILVLLESDSKAAGEARKKAQRLKKRKKQAGDLYEHDERHYLTWGQVQTLRPAVTWNFLDYHSSMPSESTLRRHPNSPKDVETIIIPNATETHGCNGAGAKGFCLEDIDRCLAPQPSGGGEPTPSAEKRTEGGQAVNGQPVQQPDDEHAHRTRLSHLEEQAMDQHRQLLREQARLIAEAMGRASRESEWSQPEGITEWARRFDVSFNTMKEWLRTQQIRNVKVSDRRYQIAVEDLPAKENQQS